jgi:hypothetical protein
MLVFSDRHYEIKFYFLCQRDEKSYLKTKQLIKLT